MRITQINDSEIAVFGSQITISLANIRVLYKQLSEFHFFRRSGSYAIYDKCEGRPVAISVLDTSDLHVVWRKRK